MKTLLDKEDLVFSPPELGCVLSLPGLPGSGSKIHDRSPYGNIGSITGATWVRLPSGLWCLSFDGQDDYISVPYSSILDFGTGDQSIEFWVKAPSNISAWSCMTSRYQDDSNRWYFSVDSSYRPYFQFYHAVGTITIQGATAINDDTWHRLALVIDNGATSYIYLDTDADGQASVTQADYSITGDLLIARRASVYAVLDIALFRICNYARSPLAILNSRNQEKHLFGVW